MTIAGRDGDKVLVGVSEMPPPEKLPPQTAMKLEVMESESGINQAIRSSCSVTPVSVQVVFSLSLLHLKKR